jgi:hypothetical protein
MLLVALVLILVALLVAGLALVLILVALLVAGQTLDGGALRVNGRLHRSWLRPWWVMQYYINYNESSSFTFACSMISLIVLLVVANE